MDLVILLVALTFVFLATLLTLLAYSGLFDSINISVGRPFIGEVVFAYRYSTGPYSNCGSFFSQTCSIAPDKISMGIYYDDPNKVPSEKLRWAVGSIISNDDGSVDDTVWKAYEKEGYKWITLPAVPESEKGLKAHPCMEIYCDGMINFMAPLSKNKEFFVPESLDPSMEVYYQ